jgi:two-component system NarL family sensor kinase
VSTHDISVPDGHPWEDMPRSERTRRVVVVVALAATYLAAIAGCGLTIAVAAAVHRTLALSDFTLIGGWMAFPAIGSVILWHKPRNAMGRLLVAMGIAGAVTVLSNAWAVYSLRVHPGALPGGAAAAWVSSWTLIVTLGTGAFVPALFPDGRITRRWQRRAAYVTAAAVVVLAASQSIASGPIDGVDPRVRPIANPLGVKALDAAGSAATRVCVAILIAFVLTSIGALALRFRRLQGVERAQMRWPLAALAILPTGVVLALLLTAVQLGDVGYVVLIGSQVALLVGLAAAIGVSVLRYRLFDFDLVVRRTLILTGVGASVAVLYGLVLLASAALVSGGGRVASVAGVAAVAVAVQPLRQRVERAVDRLMRGRLAEPLAVLSALASRLEDAIVPDDVLDAIVAAIRTELNLPYVVIELAGDAGRASSGDLAPIGARFDIVWQGETIGELGVATRIAGEPLRDSESRLLDELCRRAATAVEAARLESELKRSRERLVLNREEERRRLRRDLHDGLGPALAGLSLRADVAADVVLADPASARDQLLEVQYRLKEAVAEVRRVVSDLRPPALDELGFVGALREQAIRIAGLDMRLRIDVDASGLHALPAAIEVAAYRIVGEALTNVVRHANATSCRVDVVMNGALIVTIHDDGDGFELEELPRDGVGLESMSERSAEVGGTLTLTSRPGAGTVVRVWLPIA